MSPCPGPTSREPGLPRPRDSPLSSGDPLHPTKAFSFQFSLLICFEESHTLLCFLCQVPPSSFPMGYHESPHKTSPLFPFYLAQSPGHGCSVLSFQPGLRDRLCARKVKQH